MYELTIHSHFNATHALRLPTGMREPMHGHDWLVQITIAADRLDEHDWVMDFHALEQSLNNIIHPLNHTCLNDHAIIGSSNPSAEIVARYIADTLIPHLPPHVHLQSVSITEAPGCIATYRAGGSDERCAMSDE